MKEIEEKELKSNTGILQPLNTNIYPYSNNVVVKECSNNKPETLQKEEKKNV